MVVRWGFIYRGLLGLPDSPSFTCVPFVLCPPTLGESAPTSCECLPRGELFDSVPFVFVSRVYWLRPRPPRRAGGRPDLRVPERDPPAGSCTEEARSGLGREGSASTSSAVVFASPS